MRNTGQARAGKRQRSPHRPTLLVGRLRTRFPQPACSTARMATVNVAIATILTQPSGSRTKRTMSVSATTRRPLFTRQSRKA